MAESCFEATASGANSDATRGTEQSGRVAQALSSSQTPWYAEEMKSKKWPISLLILGLFRAWQAVLESLETGMTQLGSRPFSQSRLLIPLDRR